MCITSNYVIQIEQTESFLYSYNIQYAHISITIIEHLYIHKGL